MKLEVILKMNQLKLNRDGKMNLIKTISTAIVLLTALVGGALAQAETLKCKLHISESTKESSALVTPPHAGVSLSAIRYSGVCVFADGRIAEKQFVVINRIIGDGKTGTFLGYSVYSFKNADSLSVQFAGGWGADGARGDYTIISGTGAYANAKGDGNFVRTGGSETTSFLDVTLNVQ